MLSRLRLISSSSSLTACLLVLPWLFIGSAAQAQNLGAACNALAQASLENTRWQEVRLVEAGAYTSADDQDPALYTNLPAFCQLSGSVTTSADSEIAIEIWLPTTTWNGRLLINGYSFYGGDMDPALLAAAVQAGYATATTDGGGDGVRGAEFLLNQPEKLRDVGDRAIHEITVKSKALIESYYSAPLQYSYFEGCGGEGRQGLAAAQRYPQDFDGIAVGGIAHDTSSFAFAQLWVQDAVKASPQSALSGADLSLLNQAAVSHCDALDGVEDGLIGNPQACDFDPVELQCETRQSAQCLNSAQIVAARKIYSPVTNPRTGAWISWPLMPGSEMSWAGFDGNPNGYAAGFLRYLVFEDPQWDINERPVNYDSDVALAERVNDTFNPTNPDLSAFINNGGKLLIYGGWNDTAIPPGANLDYYRDVSRELGLETIDNNLRLVMVPGMGHCPGDFGPPLYEFDPLNLIQDWREDNAEPAPIVADVMGADGEVQREVLACAYPEVPVYSGSGSPLDAENFSCQAQ